MNELTVIEQTELEQHEEVISRGLKTFVDVGAALLAIRDNRLYRAEFGTFEDYCQERWNMDKRYANYQIAAAQVVGNLGTTVPVLPTTERHTRPLTRLDPVEQPVIWQRAVETAPNGKVTAAHVEAVVKDYTHEKNGYTNGNGNGYHHADNTYEQLADELAGDKSGYDWTEEESPVEETPVIEVQPVKPSSMAIHYSSETPEHYTPSHIIDLVLDVMGGIDLDPCSNSKVNPNVPAAVHYTPAENGLQQEWCGSVYMNPPYGREIGEWVEKLCNDFVNGKVTEAIALVPARVDTAWWNKLTSTERTYPLVCFVKGRLVFVNNEDPAPFPSALVYLGDNRIEFYSVFSAIGRIWGAWNDELAGLVDYGTN